MTLSIIAAIGNNNELGKNNELLWNLPIDMKFFREKTKNHTVIMGKNTFLSIGRPLPNRKNIIITRDQAFTYDGIEIVHSLEEALLAEKYTDNEVFIIGGAQIYVQALPFADTLYITHIKGDFVADTFFPIIDKETWQKTHEEIHEQDENNLYTCIFTTYKR